MKTKNLQTMLMVVAIAGLAWTGTTVRAQDSSGTNTVQPVVVNTSVPTLSYGVSQIVQLAQAKIGDDTIIAYIKNSGDSYGLNADQIIYLRQQGISAAVITTMLNQPRTGMASTAGKGSVSTATVAPTTVTYVQTVPDTSYYYQPYYYPPFAWFPPVAFSFGWGGHYGGGWHGGGGYHGGGYGGGFHGGGFGGGFHGGGQGGGSHGGGHR